VPPFAGGVVWCYGEKSAVPSRLPVDVIIHEGVPEVFGSARGEPSLVILDDLLNDVYSKQVYELFMRGSHHRNISVILITQNLFHQGRFCRHISLNARYIVAFKNVRNKKQFIYLASQVYPENSVGLYNAYLDGTKEAHGYLLLDLIQNTNDGLRFRTRIFPYDNPPLTVYSYVGDEASGDELSHSTGVEVGNIKLIGCVTRTLQKHKGGTSQSLRQARASLQEEKNYCTAWGFLLPLLSAVLSTLASLIFRNHVT